MKLQNDLKNNFTHRQKKFTSKNPCTSTVDASKCQIVSRKNNRLEKIILQKVYKSLYNSSRHEITRTVVLNLGTRGY